LFSTYHLPLTTNPQCFFRTFTRLPTRASLTFASEQVKRLVLGGATFIQLREKYAPMKDFFADAAPRSNLRARAM
jgi:thiamine monophosphate synthase